MGIYLNPGNKGFRESIQSAIYVDKTELIRALVKTEPAEITLFTRPHRFGKTFVMSMLASFFDIRRDSRDLFEGLKIAEDQKLCELWVNQ